MIQDLMEIAIQDVQKSIVYTITKKMEEIEQGMTNVHPEALPLVNANYRKLQRELDIEIQDLNIEFETVK